MRTLHFQIKRRGKEGKLASAGAHVQYITRGAPGVEYLQRTGLYVNRDDLMATGHGNLPPWADNNPVTFFAEGDKWERNPGAPMGDLGKNRQGRVCTQIDASLPRELLLAEQKRAVQDFIDGQLGNRHAYVWAIHQPTATDGQPYAHVHIAFSERCDTGKTITSQEYFSRMGNHKDRAFNASSWPLAARQAWSDTLNIYLEESRSLSRVDPRTLRAQGIDREPVDKVHAERLRRNNSELYERTRYAENHAATNAYWEQRKQALGITQHMLHTERVQRIGDASREHIRLQRVERDILTRGVAGVSEAELHDYLQRKDTQLQTIRTLRRDEQHYVAHPEQVRTVGHLAAVAKMVQSAQSADNTGQVLRRKRSWQDDDQERGRTHVREW